MAVRSAELPLPGGRDGVTMTLRPLICAEVPMPEGWVDGTRGIAGALGVRGPTLRAPIVAFLLEHPGAGPVLVDTGFHPDVIDDARGALGALNALVFRAIRMRPEQSIAAQLDALGVAPADLQLIVMTHLHADHASALRDFPDATVLVTDAEWEAARARGSAFAGYHAAHLDPALDYRLVTHANGGDRVADALDVFGDGSLRLLSTPGHTRGHQSVLVRLRERDALLTGDAVYTLAALRDGQRPFRTVDRDAYDASVQALAAFDRAHPEALVVPGHDMPAWEALDERYD